jgi:predicted dehydrogenase
MLDAVKKSKVKHMVNFIYRKAPAVILAKKLIDDGKIGKIYHFNCFYKQDFCLDPNFPFVWRMDADKAGGGTMADKGSHMVDLARYLVGEFAEVCSRAKVYIPYRKLPDTGEQKPVTTNDASVFIAEFQNGAIGCFEASNISAGEKNALIFEIYGEKGSIKFNLESLNELQVYYVDDDIHGYKNIMVTGKDHSYIKHWWPEGHIIGWQNLFVHQIYEFLSSIEKNSMPSPDFYDGLKCQEVVHALMLSNQNKKWVKI